jgi:hypothetical protein
MIKGKENLLIWYESQNFPYWYIYSYQNGEKKEYLAGCNCKEKGNYTIEEGKHDLQKVLEILDKETFYYIQLRKEIDSSLQNHLRGVKFILEEKKKIDKSNEYEKILPLNSELLEKKFNAEIEAIKKEFEHKIEIFKLNKEIEDLNKKLKEDKESKFEKYLPIIAGFLNKNNSVAISGFENINSNESKGSELKELLKKWKNYDKDFLTVIKKIVQIIEENTEKYENYKNMFLNI